ncbi:LysR substrate-binding domain-containing protein [Mesorhizobium sp. LHD-90]|uniref:LysR substrate-binding domain-containing protein n=1 Tax=Mesorhizobium sp. LHD-90 TaxID=3071414 RepID=UPI0027DF83B9|nr:LysR substrate-binding domain-containing protein [Mesorhizobium sp. LHD-90]MDQ6438067.1 LysR substrate-binding domain-containing protein [Mesorhizobium sp. LHD-90]
MDLRQIRYFIAVAEDEHFGRASDRIHIAQPALSRQIQMLEAELGVNLFDRLPRGIKLSAAGRTFLDYGRKIMLDLGHAVSETQAVGRGEAGMLKLGFIEVAAWSGTIPEMIMEFRRSSPGVQLVLRSMTTLDQIEAVQDGGIDAGFLYNPPANMPALTVLPIARHAVLLAVQSDSALARRQRIDVKELAGHPLISFHRRQSPTYHDELHRGLFNAGVVVNVVHEAENEAEMLALVTAGLGVALVNECQRWRIPQGLSLIPVRGLDVGLDLALVHRTGHSLPALERFLELVRGEAPGVGRRPRTRRPVEAAHT